MFSFFKKKKEEKEKPKNIKLIALCLAFEVANADNDIDVRERDLILEKIKESIDLSILTENQIFEVIQQEGKSRFPFMTSFMTSIKTWIKRRIEALRMLWEIAMQISS